MQAIKVSATRRAEHGKGAARRLRDEGKIPAVAYGKHLPTQGLAVAPEQIRHVLGTAHGRNSVIELEVDGKDKIMALLCDFQYHPLSRELLHADFFQIHMDQPVDVDVPLELTGKPVGVVMGGTLRQVFRKLPVRCLPSQIPVKITHDVTNLNLDGHVAVKELSLGEGVAARLPAEQTVAAIVTEKVRGEEEAAAPAAGAAAAPAAGAAAAAPAAAEKKAPEKKEKK